MTYPFSQSDRNPFLSSRLIHRPKGVAHSFQKSHRGELFATPHLQLRTLPYLALEPFLALKPLPKAKLEARVALPAEAKICPDNAERRVDPHP